MKSVNINAMQINIANNSTDQRSRSYDNSEVSIDHKISSRTESEKFRKWDVRTSVKKVQNTSLVNYQIYQL